MSLEQYFRGQKRSEGGTSTLVVVSECLSVQIAVAVKLAVPEVSVNTFKIEKPPPRLIQQLMVPDF